MTHRHIPAEKLVNAAQALVPYYPRPSGAEIDDIIARLSKALQVPYTIESDARLLWRQRVGLTSPTLIHVSPLQAALKRAALMSTSADDSPPIADVVEHG